MVLVPLVIVKKLNNMNESYTDLR